MANFIASHSALQQFRTCPKQFYHLRVAKDFKDTPGEAATWGLEVHKAFEDFVLLGRPMPSNMSQYQKYADAVTAMPGEKYAEMKLGMRKDGTGCGFFAEDCWLRGVIDIVVLNGQVATLVDWKLGKRVQDDEQSKLSSALVFANFPEVTEVRTRWLYLVLKDAKKKDYIVSTKDTLVKRAQGTIADVEWAKKHNSWPAKPSGLCGKHCAVTSCQHNGRR